MKRHTPSVLGDALTEREEEVLSVLTLDLTIGEVCEELGITRSTLNGHMKEIITKLGVRTRIGLVVYYFEGPKI